MSTPLTNQILRVAVIGGGASGMSAAWKLLGGGARVTLYEADRQLGGHCFAVADPESGLTVDGGVSDFNAATFHGFGEILETLELAHTPIGEDASYAWEGGRVAWYVRDGAPRFVEGVRDPARLLAEIARFKSSCVQVLADARQVGRTATDYLAEGGYGAELRDLWFVPRAGGCFPMPNRHPSSYLIQSVVEFWRIHGLVGGVSSNRRVVAGGMSTWPREFARWFLEQGGDLRLGTRVLGVARRPEGVRVASAAPEGVHRDDVFDQIIVATNANQVAALFDDVSHLQSSAFAGLSWQRARVFVHRDATMMPALRDAWGAFNYTLDGETGVPERPTITFWPKALARRPELPDDLFVSVNPCRVPDRIVSSRFLVHPAADRTHEHAHERLRTLQGVDRTWYVGAYLSAPYVHEQAVQVGVDTAQQLLRSGPVTTRASALDYLHRVPAFSSIDKTVLAEVAWATVRYRCDAGTVIYAEGGRPDGMLLIEDGEIEVSAGGKPLARLGPRAILGEMALLDGGPRTATARALTPVTAWRIDRKRLVAMRSEHEAASFAVAHALARLVATRFLDALTGTEGVVRLDGAEARSPFGQRPARTVPAGTLLLARGSPADGCGWLVAGTLQGRDGEGRLRLEIAAGGAVGLLEAFAGTVSTLDYVASAPCRLVELSLVDFLGVVQGKLPGADRLCTRFYRGLVKWYRELLAERSVDRPAPAELGAAFRSPSGSSPAA